MRFLRSLTLALVLSGGCAEAVLGPTPAPDHGSLFDELWREFDLHYSFFELKRVNWDSLGAHYRPLAIASANDAAFASVLGRMLAELKDGHVSITPVGVSAVRLMSRTDTTSAYYSSSLVFSKYVPVSQYSPARHLRYGMLSGGAGYICIPDFLGNDWAGELDLAIQQLAKATSIVIDVRSNSGGTYALAAQLAGRFADRERIFGYVRRRSGPGHGDFTDFTAETVAPVSAQRFRVRVYVLSNRRSFSTAENFILAMRVLPTVTIVGDTSAGVSGAPIVRELSNGWTYQLSEWIEYTPDHRPFEGIGLSPGVYVRATATDMLRGTDAILERAVALAAAKAP
ncbi:MAG: S41 family peptidase [bacterium]